MNGNIMGLIGVTLLAIIGTTVVAIDQMRKKRKKQRKPESL